MKTVETCGGEMKYLEKQICKECKTPIYSIIDGHVEFLKTNFKLKYSEEGTQDMIGMFGLDMKDVIRDVQFEMVFDNEFRSVINIPGFVAEYLDRKV